jgi:DNA segregation ATPase FtsK/SpoIIIE, S-DNA-T family
MPANSEKKHSSSHPEVRGLFLLACTLLLLLTLLTFKIDHPADNCLGLVGYFAAWLLTYLFGITSYFILLFTGWMGWQLLAFQKIKYCTHKIFYFSLFALSSAFLLNLCAEHSLLTPSFLKSHIYSEALSFKSPYSRPINRYYLGGVPLYYLYRDLPLFNLQKMLSDFGVGLAFSITALLSFILFTGIRIFPLLIKLKGWCLSSSPSFLKWCEGLISQEEGVPEKESEELPKKNYPPPIYAKRESPSLPALEEKKKRPDPSFKRELPPPPQKIRESDGRAYQLPPASLLNHPKKIDQPSLKKELRRQAEILEETLLSFGIEAKVGEIHSGPTITSFEVHPAIGVKVQKITALENDIALNLQAKSIRIIAPIPGKAAVGIEIPSLYPQEVSFKEMLLHYQQNPRKQQIPILLGKTVSGEIVVSDLTKMPHCIIAGATGSGKSVCINTVVMSILMNADPDEIKLLMIDPKKVELTAYKDLPHMIAPVITEAHGAYAALNWLVKEMQMRYDLLKQLGVRNISAFNNRQVNQELEASLSIPVPKKMSAIVAIIDEFADLMMVSSSDLETPIARIAQMARAVGIHLILATQRPSREVITGLIKANFPTRIAFKVASRINSQIILDETGAESLLGNGDMLFLPPGSSHLIRAQGAYISDEEIHRIISFISAQAPTQYLIQSFDVMRKEDFSEESSDLASRDTLYEQACTIVVATQTASTTFLQRKLKIGYARAASLMDELEMHGVIGPQEGSKPRRVLTSKSPLSKEELYE